MEKGREWIAAFTLLLRCKPLEILVVVQFLKPVHRCAMNVCLKARDTEILLGLDSV
jgi:hypothetical protein